MFALLNAAGILKKMFALVTKPPLSYVVILVIVAASIYGYGVYKYNQGSSDKEAEYQVLIQREIERVEEANRRALEAAHNTIKRMKITMEQRDDLLKDIDGEVSSKPDNGLSVDSVRRLNQIR